LPKAGGTVTTLNSFASTASTGALVTSGENVYVSSTQFGASGSLVSTLIVNADGSNPQTLNGTNVLRGVAPAVQSLDFGLETDYAVVLVDGLTSAFGSAGATLKVVEGATRNTLLTYGTLPTTPEGFISFGTIDPVQYGLADIKRHLKTFAWRFFGISQYKRSCVPNSPKVGSGGSLSPRGDWRAPSDGDPAVWLAAVAALPDGD